MNHETVKVKHCKTAVGGVEEDEETEDDEEVDP